jgi:hypothetical protein
MRAVGVLLLIAAIAVGVGAWLVRSRTANAAAPPPQLTVSPTQSVQQTVQVVIPGAPPGSVPSKPVAPLNSSSAHTLSTPAPVTLGDIAYDVRTCNREAEGVACNFLVTNAAEETFVVVRTFSEAEDSTVAFDSRGVSCRLRRAIFAGSSPGGLGVKARLSPTVPTPLVVIFEATPAPAFDAITLVVGIPQGNRPGAWRAVVFRNVRIDG